MVSLRAVSNFSFARVAQWIECFPPKESKQSYQNASYHLKSFHFLAFSRFADTIRYELKRFVSLPNRAISGLDVANRALNESVKRIGSFPLVVFLSRFVQFLNYVVTQETHHNKIIQIIRTATNAIYDMTAFKILKPNVASAYVALPVVTFVHGKPNGSTERFPFHLIES